jgi:hypothetical protein
VQTVDSRTQAVYRHNQVSGTFQRFVKYCPRKGIGIQKQDAGVRECIRHSRLTAKYESAMVGTPSLTATPIADRGQRHLRG